MSLKSKDTPLAEITLRRYEKPRELSQREIIKKLVLSLGLLQPGDSRDVIVDVLTVLLKAREDGKLLTSEEITALVITEREQSQVPIHGVAPSNIRRQLKRLKDLFLLDNIGNQYRIAEFNHLKEIFQEKIKQFLLPSIISRIELYLDAVDEEFRKQ